MLTASASRCNARSLILKGGTLCEMHPVLDVWRHPPLPPPAGDALSLRYQNPPVLGTLKASLLAAAHKVRSL